MLLRDQPVCPVPPVPGSTPILAGTVLVTGATGLLGSALCPLLSEAGYRLICHSRAPTNDGQPFFPLEDVTRIEPVVSQVRPDWIIHAAGNTSVDDCERDPGATRRLHIEASAELARAARRHGSRLLYVSTDSVYDGELVAPHLESEVPKPCNVYAQTKREGESACLEALDTTIVARVNFFGLHPARPAGLVAWVVGNLQAGRAFPGFTDVQFNPLSNWQLGRQFLAMMQRDLPGGIYNVGAADRCSKYDFARHIAVLLGADPALVRPVRLREAGLRTPRPRHTVMDTTKLQTLLDGPPPSLADGLRALFSNGRVT